MMKANHNNGATAKTRADVGFNILKEHDESKSQLKYYKQNTVVSWF